jgi:hypothetical protein
MLFFRNVAYIMYDVKLFVDWMEFKTKALVYVDLINLGCECLRVYSVEL